MDVFQKLMAFSPLPTKINIFITDFTGQGLKLWLKYADRPMALAIPFYVGALFLMGINRIRKKQTEE